jgi:Max protein
MSDDERDDNGLDIESDADKRAHHNALERKRRDHIKDSFCSLRDSVPSLHGEKVNAKVSKASRAQILKKAAEYIQVMRRKNTSHQQDIDDLKKQNKVLEEQIRALDKAKNGGFTNFNGTSLLDSNSKPKSESISSLDGMSDSEGGADSDTNGTNSAESFGPSAKRLKGSTGSSSPDERTCSPKVQLH